MNRIVSNYLIFAVFAMSISFISCNKANYDDNFLDDGTVQLLEMMIHPDVVDYYVKSLTQGQIENAVKYTKYEYDNQNRITKISSYNKSEILVGTETFTYRKNDLIKVLSEEADNSTKVKTTEYTRSGKKVTIKRSSNQGPVIDTTIELDKEEFPTKFESSGEGWNYLLTSQYQGGNLTKQTTIYKEGGREIQNYSYTFNYDKNKSPFFHCQTPKWYMFYVSHVFGSKNNLIQEIGVAAGQVYNKTDYKYEYDRNGFPTKRITNINGREYVVEFRYK